METVSYLVVLVLIGVGLSANAERHSLHYIYTALSRPVENQGIHEFTAMGMLDDNPVDYFDSDKKVKVPKQSWMEKKLEESYWEKGTQSRRSKQQWFKVNLNILKERFRQNDSDIHVLQWIHGCEIETSGSETRFVHGIDMYSYDSSNFLSFDENKENWVAPCEVARQTKNRWDQLPVLKEYTKVYLKNECVNWLKNFLNYQKESGAPVKPDVYVFSTAAKVKTNLVLTCMATGFSSTNTVIQIKRDGRVLTQNDGVQSSGTRPNGDGTFQQRDYVEIQKSDTSLYTCEVSHGSSGLHVVQEFVKVDDNSMVVLISVVGVVVLVLVAIVIAVPILIKKFVNVKPKANKLEVRKDDLLEKEPKFQTPSLDGKAPLLNKGSNSTVKSDCSSSDSSTRSSKDNCCC